MAMRRRTKVILAVLFVPIGVVAVLLLLAQFGPSIELVNNVKGGMTRDEVVQALGPPTDERVDKFEYRILGWDLKDGKFGVYVNPKGQVTPRDIDDSQPLSADAPGFANAKTLADTGKFGNQATREEVEKVLGPPNREREEKYENLSMFWDFKDGVVIVRFDKKQRVFSDGAKSYPISTWERFRDSIRKLGSGPKGKGWF